MPNLEELERMAPECRTVVATIVHIAAKRFGKSAEQAWSALESGALKIVLTDSNNLGGGMASATVAIEWPEAST